MDRHESFDRRIDDHGQSNPGPADEKAYEQSQPASRERGGQPGEREGEDGSHRGQRSDKAEAGTDERKPIGLVARIAIIVLVAIVILAAIAYGIYWWLRGSYYQSTNDAYLQTDQVSIAPRISGYVDEVLVRDNQEVAAGQILLRVSDRDFRANIEQDRAQIAEAQADVLESRAKMRQQRAQIAQSDAQETQSKAQERQNAASARFNDAEARRYGPLAASGAETTEKLASYVSQARQSRAQLEASNAQSAADAAKAEYSRRQIGIYEAEQIGDQAKIQRAEAQLAADQVDLDATIVVSKIAGRVGDRTVRVGQYLQLGHSRDDHRASPVIVSEG